jgi:4-hydroxy-tetrahydrodipicolinate synthase
LHRDLFVESNPIPVKYAVSKLGFGANVLRLPLTKLAVENQGFIDAAMSKVELC